MAASCSTSARRLAQARLGYSVLLERLTSVLVLAVGRMLMGRTGYEPLALARLACNVGDDEAPEAAVCRNVLALLEGQERFAREHPGDGPPLAPGIRSIMLAATISRTPDVPLPPLPAFATGDDSARRGRRRVTGRSRRRSCTVSSCPRCRRICATRRPRIS